MPHMTMEVFPETQILPESAITTARHIAQNPIELEVLAVAALLHIWELSSVIIGHHQSGKIEFRGLMCKQKRALGVCIICNQKSSVHTFLILVKGF